MPILNFRKYSQLLAEISRHLFTRYPRIIGTATAATVLLLAAWAWLEDPFGRRQTLGSIWVATPEIYTRERLVNDRFVQDAWLTQQLNGSKEIVESLQIVEDRRSARLQGGSVSTNNESKAETGTRGTIDTVPRQSSRDLLLSELDFRDLIRNMAAENQLDDRHDLNGNSLYRFKFDATVVPGNNTQATAVISVSLSGSSVILSTSPSTHASGAVDKRSALSELGTAEEIQRWRVVYARWIESLRSRLYQTHKELKQAYASNEFAHNDYARLIAFLERNLHLTAAS